MERGYGEMVIPVWGVEENFPGGNVEGKKSSGRVVDKRKVFVVKSNKERIKRDVSINISNI